MKTESRKPEPVSVTALQPKRASSFNPPRVKTPIRLVDGTVVPPTMNMDWWRKKHACSLHLTRLEHTYRREATASDYRKLKSLLEDGEIGGTKGERPQIHRANAPRTVSRFVPTWFYNDRAITEFLQIQFPNAMLSRDHPNEIHFCNCKGCRSARRAMLWLFIIRSTRANDSAPMVADDWNTAYSGYLPVTKGRVRRILQEIRFIAGGQRTDGKPRSGKRGRPRKNMCKAGILEEAPICS